MTPTARTLKWLRERGYTAEVVERWNPHSRTRKDLFGFADVAAIGNPLTGCACTGVHNEHVCNNRLILIQCCAGASHAARRSKAAPLAVRWKDCGGLAYVVSWSKRGPRGKRKTWQVRIEAL